MRTLKNMSFSVLLCLLLFGRPTLVRSGQSSFDELMDTIRTGNAHQRAWAIPLLSQTGNVRVVPVLIELLKDADNAVRTYAAQQLDRLADKRSTEALAAVLDDPYSNVRFYAARALGKLGAEEHAPKLAKAIMNNLPDPNHPQNNASSMTAMLETFSSLSRTAPPEIISLLGPVGRGNEIRSDWWWFYEALAQCFGRIGDRAAFDELKRVDKALSSGQQDYETWYAVRKALAGIEPVMRFDRPAAEILYSVRIFKISWEGIKQRWVEPLAKQGEDALGDLEWAIKFDSQRDQQRKQIAIEAIGDIGGGEARAILRRYIRRTSKLSGADRIAEHRYRYALRMALRGLLKAEPSEAAVREVIAGSQLVDSFDREYLVNDISREPPEKIPGRIKLLFYEKVLLTPEPTKSRSRYGQHAAAKCLGQTGGRRAGEILSKALLEAPDSTAAKSAATALVSIAGYDAVPALIKASELPGAPVATIAQAMGAIGDNRAVRALKDMAGRDKLRPGDRLWIAAALARLDVDYAGNAQIVRKALPDSLEHAGWLHDDRTIKLVAAFLESTEDYTSERATAALEAVGTEDAFEAITALIDAETITDPIRLHKLSSAAARMAKKLAIDSGGHYAEVAEVSEIVRGWFAGMQQQADPGAVRSNKLDTIKRHEGLARKLWMAEARRKLDLTAKSNQKDPASQVPEEAVAAAEHIFGPEVVPLLERIAAESRSKVSFHGKNAMVEFYHVRSMAAGILTERTGRKHTFVGTDGKTHPGGWNPSDEE